MAHIAYDGTAFRTAESLSEYHTELERLQEEYERNRQEAVVRYVREKATGVRRRLRFKETLIDVLTANEITTLDELVDSLSRPNVIMFDLPADLTMMNAKWTQEEEELLLSSYDLFVTLSSAAHGRTRSAIRSALTKVLGNQR